MASKDKIISCGTTTFELNDSPKEDQNESPCGNRTTSISYKGFQCSIPKRYIFSLMNFLAVFINNCQLGNMSISIVAMVNLTAFSTNQSRSEECPAPLQTEQEPHKGGDILWSPQHVGLVLGATALGAMVAKIPGGRLAERFECKKLIGFFLITSSLLTLLVPLAVQWGSYPTMILRFLIGLALGPSTPEVLVMLGHWIPKSEKHFYISVIFSGVLTGTVLSPLIFASLCDSNFLGGWPSVFYVSGVLGLVCAVFWFYLIYETPAQHPTISEKELKFIMDNITHQKQSKCLAIPWMKMLTSVPLWAFISGYLSCGWCLGFFLTVHSLYLGSMLHMPITKNGLHSSLPHMPRLLFMWLGAFCTQWIAKKKYFSPDLTAKLWNILNIFLATLSFLGITLVGCNETLVTVLFVLSSMLHGTAMSEIGTICSNMAPALSGTILGIAETLGSSTLFIIPAIVGGLMEHEQTMLQWNKIFYINMAVIGVASFVFILFATNQEQSWAVQKDDEEKVTSNSTSV